MSASISIEGPVSSNPGAVSAAIANISLDAVRGETGSTSAAPLGGIALGGIAMGGIPLGGIGFTLQNLNQNGLGGVPLSTIPIQPPDTWEAHLALDPAFAGTPPQNVTLAQVLGTPVVNGVTLDDLNLASSPLGGIPLGGIPLGGIANSTPEQNRSDWCDYINEQSGFSCPDGDSLIGETMLGLALQGVPLEDRAGHVYDANVTYEVKPYVFTGFFSPIANPPAFNSVNAGSTVPIKFSLGAFRGLSIFAQGSPSSQPMTCAGVVTDPIGQIVPPGSSMLTYNPSRNQYQLNWKTEARWRNTCRQLTVRLKDGV